MLPRTQKIHYRMLDTLSNQRDLLMDSVRVDAYWSIINEKKSIFKNNVIMEVCCGTGMLSVLCAKAGARKVYAIEESPKLAQLAKQVFADNNVDDKIEVLTGDIESLIIEEQVDVIISDWMGYFLLDGGILNKVITARTFLKKEGIMIPGSAALYAALFTYEPAYRKWENVNGVQLSAVTKQYKKQLTLYPCRESLKEENIVSETKLLFHLDMRLADKEAIKDITTNVVLVPTKEVDGLCIWWKASLFNNYSLTTSPFHDETHWRQILLFFPDLQDLNEEPSLSIGLNFKKVDEVKYNISLEIRKPEESDHPIPCECSSLKCLIIRTYLNEVGPQE